MPKKFFKPWEIFLILISLFLFVLSFSIYITDFPIRNYIFDLPDDNSNVVIGALKSKQGSIRRQISGETEFKSLQEQSNLFNLDTIVTGGGSGATLVFENGSTLDLGQNTMIRLSFLKNVTLSGLKQYGNVEVITGEVTGSAGKNKLFLKSSHGSLEVKPNTTESFKAKKIAFVPNENPSPTPSPSPSPTPTGFTAEEIKKTRVLSVQVDDAVVLDEAHPLARKKVYLKWSANPVHKNILVYVTKLIQEDKDSDIKKKKIFRKTLPIKKAKGELGFFVAEPGQYEWGILGAEGNPITSPEYSSGKFVVNPEFVGISVLSPLIAGKESSSNKLTQDLLKENDFNIQLRWKKYKNINKYFLWFGKSATSKHPFLQKTVDKEEFSFNKTKAFAGQFFYKITSIANNGYIASSGIQKFSFNFEAPLQVLPENNSSLSVKDLKKTKRIMLTWQKTNFTQVYQVEVSLTPDFSKIYLRKKLTANFYFMPIQVMGQHWWRVRGFSNNLSSPISQAWTFFVIP